MNIQSIVEHIQSVIGVRENFTPLHIPIFDEREVELLRECVESNFVSSVGAFCDRFEAALSEYTGAKRAVLCVNGTSALHLALRVAGVEEGDEVLIPSLSFVATGNAVRYAGAVPHFVDCEAQHFGVDPEKLRTHLHAISEQKEGVTYNRETGKAIRCMVVMHAFGHPVLINELVAVAKEFGIKMVEDAAESLGSFYKGQHTGTFGECGILSFNGNKVMTTGGGGAILFNDDALADRAKYLSTTAKRPHKWEFFHDEMGYNYRMPALNAAMGCAQIEKLPKMLEQKRALAKRYAVAFKGATGLRFLEEPEGSQSNYWLNTIVLDEACADQRDDLLEATNSQNIMTRPVWTPLHLLPMFADCPRMSLGVTETMALRVVNIPSTASL